MTIERLLEAGRALDAGELERAEQIYRQVAEADPRSSIAVVGLARVALRRGASAEAARLAASALAIDPGNAAARRLVEGGRSPSSSTTEAVPGGAVAREPRSTAPPSGAASPTAPDTRPGNGAADAEWPWPDLEAQLARYREPSPGLVARLLRRGKRT